MNKNKKLEDLKSQIFKLSDEVSNFTTGGGIFDFVGKFTGKLNWITINENSCFGSGTDDNGNKTWWEK